MNRRRKFCVITTPRSGSSWLSSLLDSHTQIKSFGEPFLWKKNRRNWTDKDFPSYYDYKNNSSTKSPLVLFKYLDILDSYKVEKEFDIIGFKIMYDHVLKNPEILIKFILDKYKIIHLSRQNYLDILISRTALYQHGLVHSNQTATNTTQVTLNPSSLIGELSRLDRNYKIMKILLKLMPLPVMEIKYESLVENRDKVLYLLAEFLEADTSTMTFDSQLKRTNPGIYEEKIANYNQVVQTLEGSKYADFLII